MITIGVSVNGIWTDSITIKEHLPWYMVKELVGLRIGMEEYMFNMQPYATDDNTNCDLIDGDDVICMWSCDYYTHPIHFAADCGRTDIVKNWVMAGTDVDLVTVSTNVYIMNGVTPLMFAIGYGNMETAMMLLQVGARCTLRDMQGHSMLHYVAQGEWDLNEENIIPQLQNLVKLLIEAGCDPNWRTSDPAYNDMTALEMLRALYDTVSEEILQIMTDVFEIGIRDANV